jgi:hypothetical protein
MRISTLPEPTKVISLKEARNKYRPDKCRHRNMTVDAELNEVECDDCGAKLNPVAMLMRFANEESRWAREGEHLKELHKELDARVRCKCQHCGQMTRIRL